MERSLISLLLHSLNCVLNGMHKVWVFFSFFAFCISHFENWEGQGSSPQINHYCIIGPFAKEHQYLLVHTYFLRQVLGSHPCPLESGCSSFSYIPAPSMRPRRPASIAGNQGKVMSSNSGLLRCSCVLEAACLHVHSGSHAICWLCSTLCNQ